MRLMVYKGACRHVFTVCGRLRSLPRDPCEPFCSPPTVRHGVTKTLWTVVVNGRVEVKRSNMHTRLEPPLFGVFAYLWFAQSL